MNNGAIQVPYGSTAEGEKMLVGKPNKALNEFWELIPVEKPEFSGQNAYYFRSFCGFCLDVCEGKAKKNQAIIQWKYNGNKNQIWIIDQAWFKS